MIYILIDDNNKVTLGSTIIPNDGQNWVEYSGIIPKGNVLNLINGTLVIDSDELNKIKLELIQKLEIEYEIDNTQNISYMGTTFQADSKSQSLIVSAISAGNVPIGFFWRDLANVQLNMTFAELQGLSYKILERGQLNFIKWIDLKNSIVNAVNAEDLDAIYWTDPIPE